MDRSRINIGIIGLGTIFQHQVQALGHVSGYALTALHDIDPSRKNLARDVPFYDSLDSFLAVEELDVVLISVPVAKHFEIASRALIAGKHVLLEKPACRELEQLRKLKGLAERHGVTLNVAVHAAFAPEMLFFEERLAEEFSEKYGPITAVRGLFYDPYMADGKLLKEYAGLGGSWMDSGINALSVMDRVIDITEMRFDRADRSCLPGLPIRETQCVSHYRFPVDGHSTLGWAMVDTNWMLGVNRKKTDLFYHRGGTVVTLDHSEQKVLQARLDGGVEELADMGAGRERLVNHYIGLFDNYFRNVFPVASNIDRMLLMHRLFFDVYEPSSAS